MDFTTVSTVSVSESLGTFCLGFLEGDVLEAFFFEQISEFNASPSFSCRLPFRLSNADKFERGFEFCDSESMRVRSCLGISLQELEAGIEVLNVSPLGAINGP